MAVVGSLLVELRGDVARLQRDLGRAVELSKRRSREIQRMWRNVARTIGASFAAAGFGAFINSTVEAGDEVQKLATRLGASTEALSQYRLVAERSGVSFNTLTMGMQRMVRRVAEAAQGTGEAKDALRELGLDATRLQQLRPSEQFEVLAEALSRVGNSSDRVRLAMKLFDSEGVALLQTMEGGAEGIRRMRAEADALGMTLTQNQANKMAAVNDAVARLQGAYTGLANTIVLQLGPALVAVANFIGRGLPNVSNVGARAIAAIKTAFYELGAGISGALASWNEFRAKITFGSVSERFLEAARKNREQELAFWQKAAQETQVQIEALIDKETRFSVNAGKWFANLGAAAVDASRSISAVAKSTVLSQRGDISTDKVRDEAERLKNILDRLFPNQARARQFAEELAIVKDALGENSEAARRLEEEFAKATGGPRKLAESVKKSADEMSTYAEQAARNIQNALADFLFDPFDKGLKGMLDSFVMTLRRMAAQKAASGILDWVSSKAGKGSFGQLLSSVIPGFAHGTSFAPGGLALVGERGPELVSLRRGAQVIPGDKLPTAQSVTNVNVNVTVPGGVRDARQSANQIGVQVARAIERARRRNG